jgi:hypothetical protein
VRATLPSDILASWNARLRTRGHREPRKPGASVQWWVVPAGAGTRVQLQRPTEDGFRYGQIVGKSNGDGRGAAYRVVKPNDNMKQQNAVDSFLAGRRVVITRFVAHRYKEVQNKSGKVVGIVNLYEVHCADGKAPTVQTWCPRSVQTIEQAIKECPCAFKDGQKVMVEFDLMEPNTFDAKNGVIIRAGSVLLLE